MIIYTMGFTQKSARKFFELIKKNQIDILLDIRLNNKSQLAGFTKGDDLSYFLSKICQCKYQYCDEYAPTKDIMEDYKTNKITWDDYVDRYTWLIRSKNVLEKFPETVKDYENICLLCSEPTPEHCHRKLLAEMLAENNPTWIIKHI
jgi:uncharacterized protein (DUF488 family)